MKLEGILLLSFYLLFRVIVDHGVSLSHWIVLSIELGLVGFFLLRHGQNEKWRLSLGRRQLNGVLLNLLLGFFCFRVATWNNWSVPFDFTSAEILFLLLLVAPILEELIFRLVLWRAFVFVGLPLRPTWILCSALFALAHLSFLPHLPETYHPFVIFQGVYTFFMSLHWGWQRKKQDTVLAAIVLHFAFNLGFLLSALLLTLPAFSPKPIKVMMLDLSVSQSSLDRSFPQNTPELINERPFQKTLSNCEKSYQIVDLHFESLKQGTIPHWKADEVERLKNGVERAHPLHMWTPLLATDIQIEGYHFGAHDPAGPQEFKNVTELLSKAQQDLKDFKQKISEIQPDMVIAATSESLEENYIELLTAGHDPISAQEHAESIMRLWTTLWQEILNENPNTIFLVSAGNGGIDNVGDLLSVDANNTQSIPAALQAENLLVVGSSNEEGCPSRFSNYSAELVDVFVRGEMIEGASGCAERPNVFLSGSSQALAVFAPWAAKELSHGRSVRKGLERAGLQDKTCLQGKSRYGLITSP